MNWGGKEPPANNLVCMSKLYVVTTSNLYKVSFDKERKLLLSREGIFGGSFLGMVQR